jgi:AAA domain
MEEPMTKFTFQQPFWQANYGIPLRAEYADNPLILTLPVYTQDQALQYLSVRPDYHEEMRQGTSPERLEALLEASDFFQPLTQHLDLEQRFARMLRRGYLGRNPLAHGYWVETHTRCQSLTNFVPGQAHQSARTQGFTLLGISGIGKSRALERILMLYPQVIVHDHFKERRFTWVQLVWLKLDCPQDGSLKGLCQAFFEEVDTILGTNYYATYASQGKATTDQMLVFMARVARLHSIGTLVIDELQNLRQGSGNMAEKMLNFFVQLDNIIGVPMILVGTPKALDLLAGEFRRARRAIGQGDPIWNRMPEQDPDWDLLIDALWGYQFVQKAAPLTPQLRHALYIESQGITDVAIKLYFLTQIAAIFYGTEDITSKSLHQTALRDLQLIQPFIIALRHNDRQALLRYDDIRKIDLREVIKAKPSAVGNSRNPDIASLPIASATPLEEERQDAPATNGSYKKIPVTGYENLRAAGLTRSTLGVSSAIGREGIFLDLPKEELANAMSGVPTTGERT